MQHVCLTGQKEAGDLPIHPCLKLYMQQGHFKFETCYHLLKLPEKNAKIQFNG